MTKAFLRQHFLAERKNLLGVDLQTGEPAIVHHLMNELRDDVKIRPALTLHTYLPILRQREIDTWPVIHWLWRSHPAVRVTSSITDVKNHRLIHYRLTPDTALVTNRWGIPEPTDPELYVSADVIDVVLIPLLAFDRRGHRVGYGGGFYDRFMADCRPDCRKIGLSWFDPIDTISDVESTDIALNACVTPRRVYTFTTGH